MALPKLSTGALNIYADPLLGSATSPTTSPAASSKQEDSDPNYTLNYEEPVIPEVDPLAVEVSDLSGLELARSVLEDGAWQLVLLDETLKGLNPVEERSEIESMKQVLCRTGKQAVVVLHSRSNLDCFETVVNIGERTRF